MKRTIVVPLVTAASQKQAADPALSIWVSANAGSGKTYVLTRRVLRLLLSGVAPESILCLTYTKAAAAEMRRRVSAQLARWALMEEAKLGEELLALEGQSASTILLARARSLFAHALETPGGLKIVTIHAFCESVLHRFPLEAQVPFDFSVIEEAEQQGMILGAREGVLADGLKGDPALIGPVTTLFELMSDHAITDAIDTALAEGRKLRPLLRDRPKAKANLRKQVNAGGHEDSLAVLEEILRGRLLGPVEYARILEITPPKGGSQLEDKLARIDAALPAPRALLQTFLTADGTVPKRFPKKAISDSDPDLAETMIAEAERLEALGQRLTRAALIERSEALLDVLGAISDRYEAQKRARSLLDFDDLIERLGDLFANRAHADWVKYKLDAGITHILVDESQDTNPEQWRVVREIADEFFAGESAVQRPRTLFAVGDEKQSIYSFQGADPRLFSEQERHFSKKAKESEKKVEPVRLNTSFRSMRSVLSAVDTVFANDELRAALLSPGGIMHDSAISEPGGMVTLWPPIQQEAESVDADEWPLTAPDASKSAARQVAERIAGEIRRWVDDERPLGLRERGVSPNDVLILVQSRNALFQELIRAVIKQKLPTPGADRLAVTTHIGVLDLIALGDVLLNTGDDLQLAALLRSPLFDIDEDDLLLIAGGRDGPLWDALRLCDKPSARYAFEKLDHWRDRLDFERPYEFFAEILYAEGGLRRFHARLGTEVDDVFAQFLDLALAHEQSSQPSLQGFLAALRGANVSIKRELAESGSGVRVMTVHGAKGLEAPIVILADAASKPEGRQLGKSVYLVNEAPGPMLIHASSRKDHVLETENFRDDDQGNQKDEYWRKLYVGMTRAEDELYITGTMTKDGKLEGSWYEAVDMALRPLAEVALDGDGNEKAMIYPRERPAPLPIATAQPGMAADAVVNDFARLPAPKRVTLVSPSSAYTSADSLKVYDTALEGVVDAEAARKEGLALHALLQHLGKVDRGDWPMVIDKAMPMLLAEHPERHEALGEKAQRILDNPEFAHIFGSGSRAEVPFLADALRNGTPIRLAGRIDRLVVSATNVLVIDYKSDGNVPESAADVPGAYLTQLGLYALVATQLFPAHDVTAAILWTTMESLMILPSDRLGKATEAFTIR